MPINMDRIHAYYAMLPYGLTRQRRAELRQEVQQLSAEEQADIREVRGRPGNIQHRNDTYTALGINHQARASRDSLFIASRSPSPAPTSPNAISAPPIQPQSPFSWQLPENPASAIPQHSETMDSLLASATGQRISLGADASIPPASRPFRIPTLVRQNDMSPVRGSAPHSVRPRRRRLISSTTRPPNSRQASPRSYHTAYFKRYGDTPDNPTTVTGLLGPLWENSSWVNIRPGKI